MEEGIVCFSWFVLSGLLSSRHYGSSLPLLTVCSHPQKPRLVISCDKVFHRGKIKCGDRKSVLYSNGVILLHGQVNNQRVCRRRSWWGRTSTQSVVLFAMSSAQETCHGLWWNHFSLRSSDHTEMIWYHLSYLHFTSSSRWREPCLARDTSSVNWVKMRSAGTHLKMSPRFRIYKALQREHK